SERLPERPPEINAIRRQFSKGKPLSPCREQVYFFAMQKTVSPRSAEWGTADAPDGRSPETWGGLPMKKLAKEKGTDLKNTHGDGLKKPTPRAVPLVARSPPPTLP